VRSLLRALLEPLFRVLFAFECRGEEKIPPTGAAVIVANHSSYLDPILLSLDVSRPIHFMAWDAFFKRPILGSLMEAFGAFPVDIHPGQGRHAYDQAKTLLEAGELVGIFPEGRRSHMRWMEMSLREGAARLAWETGVPLIPASIAGAYRAWPYSRALPSPARVKVRFHDPIDPQPFRVLPEEEAVPALLQKVRESVERSLLPGVKADLRRNVLYGMPAAFPRLFEFLPAFGLAVLLFWKTRSRLQMAPPYGYLLYLLLDHYVIPQGRLVKWIRNVSSVAFLLGFSPIVLSVLGLPQPPSREALAAILAGALFPYLYEHGRVALAFIRGLVTAIVIAGGTYALFPVPFGPHLSLPLYVAAFAWERKTVAWRFTTPLLISYAAYCVWVMGPNGAVVPHATAALLAWLSTRLFPYRPDGEHPERHTLEGLGLRE
jgi:1-acyl-sn-glycerol-3-phosphate acyltransferase